MTSVHNPGPNSYVLLQVGKRRFALPADTVEELAPPVRLHGFPHRSPLVVGVIVRRGHIVPVYDVAPVLLGESSPAHRFYLVARRMFGRASEPSAIPVSGECELASCEMQPPQASWPAYVAGRIEVGDESLDVLNLEALVTSPAATNQSFETAAWEAQP
jgi:chemotaxis signal transduction protein